MLERFVEQFEAITATLCLVDNKDLYLTSDEKRKISEAITILEPFLEATENILGDKYVSTSMILPLKNLLQQQCSTSQSTPIATVLAEEIHRRFCSLESSFVTGVTTLLDPRFKKITLQLLTRQKIESSAK